MGRHRLVYLNSIGAGIATSILLVIVVAVIMVVMNPNQEGIVEIRIFGLIPMTLMVVGFAAGIFLFLRNSN